MTTPTLTTTNCCPCGVAIKTGGRPNTSGLCTDCVKKARATKYEETRRAKKRIEAKYPVRNLQASPRSTTPIPETKKPVQHAYFVQNAPSAPKQVKVFTPTPTETQTGQNTDTQEAPRQTAAQAKAERDCLTGLASLTVAIKEGMTGFYGATFELHATTDPKKATQYTPQRRNTQPKAGYRAVKRFWRNGRGNWDEAVITGFRKTDDESED